MTSLLFALAAVGGFLGVPLGRYSELLLAQPRRLSSAARVSIVVVTAVLFALAVLRFGIAWELPAFCFLAGVAVLLSTVDLIEKRLPNVVLYPGLCLTVLLLAGAAWAGNAWPTFLGAVAGGAGLFLLYFALAVVSPSGIGMGDVKLAALVGLALGYLGWLPLLIGATAGFLIGGVTSLTALVSGRAGLKTSIAFGPAMLAGACVGIFVG